MRDHPRSWAAILSRSECTLVAGDRELLDRLAPECPPGMEFLGFSERPAPGKATAASDSKIDDIAWVVPTSGTTGTPKLALLTHTSLLAAARGCAEARPVAADDVYLLAFPLCHVAAYNVLVQHLHGRTVVVTRRFEPRRTAQLIERHRVTVASLAPTMIAALLDHITAPASGGREAQHDLSSLRLLAYGSASIAEPLLRRAMAELGCDFSQGYGMTELSGNSAYLDADGHRRGLDDPEVLRSAGRPTSFVELRIVDDRGVAVATGEVGEIAVRGPQVMAGYLGDPDATAAAIVDGWLRTGDLGRVDAEGVLTIVDRKKDVIVSGGENVASREVEAVLHADPTVAEAAVIGVPDDRWGERVTAVVVPARDAHVDEDALVARCRGELAAYKIPRRVLIVDALPRECHRQDRQARTAAPLRHGIGARRRRRRHRARQHGHRGNGPDDPGGPGVSAPVPSTAPLTWADAGGPSERFLVTTHSEMQVTVSEWLRRSTSAQRPLCCRRYPTFAKRRKGA